MPKSFRVSGSETIAFGALRAAEDVKVLLLDGGMGHELKGKGLDVGLDDEHKNTFLTAAIANLADAEAVKDLHKEYLEAGCDIVTSNTYACTNHMLSKVDCASKQTQLLESACDNAIDAIDEVASGGDRMRLLAGSLPPLAESYQTEGLAEDNDLKEEYAKIIEALNPCVDLFLAETLCSVREVKAVCEALSAVPRPLILGVSLKDDGSNKLRSGEDLQAALDVTKDYGFVRGLVVNCSSPAAVGAALPVLKAASEAISKDIEEPVRFGGYANLFKKSTDEWLGGEAPAVTTEDGDFSGDVMTPAGYAKHVGSWIAAGATIVGACCGSTPAHIKACREVIDSA